MKRIIYFYCVTFVVIGCSKKNSLPLESKEFYVDILNETITIPRHDSIPCVDTIYTLLINKSEYEYVYLMADSCLFFSDGQLIYDIPLDADPSDGIIIRFLDNKNSYLKVDITAGYTDTPFFDDIADAKYLKPNSTYLIKTPLKFPHHINEISQRVNFLSRTKKVAVIFNSFGFQSYNSDYFRKRLNQNQRILGIRYEEFIPVVFKE
ncbi:MAG TPA: hypothetical protein PKA12_16535 [Saprospiraceae bacterium]|nr:hypothetical protein [Saprospiraceae bacterium]